MAFLDLGGVRLLLGLGEGTGPEHRASVLYLRAADIAASHRALAGRGVVFDGKPHKVHEDARHELWLATFRDPEGNALALMAERPK
jgi:methylmalonyl-CoA/ethylmalonyl-CoA epimerase